MTKKIHSFLLSLLLLTPMILLAQTEPEDVATTNNEFQDLFYESLLQKGIENYDKAIETLQKCAKLEPNNAVIYFEMGKNYLGSKNYKKAYSNFEKATQIDPNNKWYWVGMYDAAYANKDFTNGLISLNKLITFNERYKEDLITLYIATKEYDKALLLINECNEKFGKSEKRERYKIDILSQEKYQKDEINNLLNQINKSPKDEANYIALINLYSKNNEQEKAISIAKKMTDIFPTSEWMQVTMFKQYLDKNEIINATKAMNAVLEGKQVDVKIKHRILNEFLIYTYNNQQYAPDLDKAIKYFDNDANVNVNQEIGIFYYNKKDYQNAIKYFEQAYNKTKPVEMKANLLLLEAYCQTKKFNEASQKASELIEIFPAEAKLYYFSGLANNELKNFKKAKDNLETGLDYIVEDKNLEVNFYNQLIITYNALGDVKKKDFYTTKVNHLK